MLLHKEKKSDRGSLGLSDGVVCIFLCRYVYDTIFFFSVVDFDINVQELNEKKVEIKLCRE